jgi:cell wall-associated NlpC family hydrolase
VGKGTTVAVAFLGGLILFIGAGAIAVVQSVFGSSGGGADCAPAGSTSSSAAGYGPEQMINAAIIVAVGKQMIAPEQGWVIAIATAMQESGLNNLNYGDRDSLGLFQQRPSQGWGTPAQIMDPTYAATQFYRHLLVVNGWQQMSVNAAAQTVQHSGMPNAYAQHEQAARQVVGAVQGSVCTPSDRGDCNNLRLPDSAAQAAVIFACQQRGKPYVWGGNGDPGFDCSGLTHAAYASAGIAIPRTAQTQYNAGPLIPAGILLQPGDLVFYGSGPQSVTHVGIAISPSRIVDAPHNGAAVESTDVGRYLAASRPATSTAA